MAVMNKIWEFMYENQEKIRYRQTEYFSPYYEVSQESIKETEKQTYQVSFNSFYRYEKVFESLFDIDLKEESRKLLFDCILHYLVCEEFKLGMTGEEYEIRKCFHAIEQGVYGDNVQQMFQSLSKEKTFDCPYPLQAKQDSGKCISVCHNSYKNTGQLRGIPE